MYMLQLVGTQMPVLFMIRCHSATPHVCLCVCVDPSVQLQIDHDVPSRVCHLNSMT